FILPLDRIDGLCAERGLPLIVDASQSAGVLPLNAGAMRAAAFLCMPGHKALYGPQGTGILLCCQDKTLYSLIEGGTGSLSLETRQPDFLPDMLESGTLNVPGIAGLREGLRFVSREREAIRRREERLLHQAAEGLSLLPGIEVYVSRQCQSGVLSFRSRRCDPADLCQRLADRGVCLRGGLHCAPLAHRSGGTLPEGTARLSFSAFTTPAELERFLWILNELLKSA
ncbi:MAG: aminotransferase class V-fold PLP-dependent enzyme, partial [Clostridia bacterium]|nr:aminotransferase class V-fold PLP-dependent enzyme [Clostridia bacterium]